jgi:KDO2-lipid IV(A) lauroyltransferase
MRRRQAIVRKNLEIVNTWILSGDEGRRNSSEISFTGFQGDKSSLQNGYSTLSLEGQVREVFLRSGANLFAGFTFNRMGSEEAEKYIEIEGIDNLKDALAGEKGAIVLLAHMGPWEALAQLPEFGRRRGVSAPFGAMYRPLNNFYLDEWYKSQREAQGTFLFSRRDGFHRPVDFIRSGGMLGILADQKMREGPRAPYFGQIVPSTPIPGLFHRRSSAPILALSVFTVGTCRWKLHLRPVEVPDSADIRDRSVMAAICNRATAESLSQSPLDGFWLHKRF